MVGVELEHFGEILMRFFDATALEEGHASAEAAVVVIGAHLEDLGEVAHGQIPQLMRNNGFRKPWRRRFFWGR